VSRPVVRPALPADKLRGQGYGWRDRVYVVAGGDVISKFML